MKLSEYVTLDALGMAQLVKQGEITPRELLECALIQTEAQGEPINAVASVDQARALERTSQTTNGPFQGVPLLLKELLNYPGLRTAWDHGCSNTTYRPKVQRTPNGWTTSAWWCSAIVPVRSSGY